MAEYHLTNKAVEDLNGIWEYTFDYWSEEQADKYYSMLLEFFQTIADNPESGKNYDGIVTGISGLRAHRHIIFYRKINTGMIEIIRILHERMDLKSRISE